MSLPKKMAQRRREDARVEIALRIRKHDPQVDTAGGIRYSPADIEALEEERVPWLKARRRRQG